MQTLTLKAGIAAALLSLCTAQGALAHTTIADNTVTEGGSMLTGISISHGCDNTAVRAMSAVFPLGADTVAKDGAGNPVVLADHFEGVTATGLSLGLAMVQDKDVFKTQSEVANGGVVRAFRYDFGYLDPTLHAHVPFRISKPVFKVASCANKLVMRIPIANWCSKSQTDPARADIWLGTPTPLFNDNNGEVVSDNFWPTLTVNRTSALPANCGAGVTVTVEPSAATIDQFLPIAGYWPTP